MPRARATHRSVLVVSLAILTPSAMHATRRGIALQLFEFQHKRPKIDDKHDPEIDGASLIGKARGASLGLAETWRGRGRGPRAVGHRVFSGLQSVIPVGVSRKDEIERWVVLPGTCADAAASRRFDAQSLCVALGGCIVRFFNASASREDFAKCQYD